MAESLRERFVREHPDFPLLDAGRPETVASFLRARGWIGPTERLVACGRAGEGNMNLTLRVVTDRRRFVLKQARPWVEKYGHIAAPFDRMEAERRFYERAAAIPGVGERMPRLLGADPEARVILLEEIEGASDLTRLYRGEPASPFLVDALAAYLRALHEATRGAPDPAFANRAMRALNHAHIFEVPLASPDGAVDLDRLEPGLLAAARRLVEDAAYRESVRELGRRYLADGPCLLHGDYFPGSWLERAGALYAIDPEFCFYGDPEHDVGVAVAHFALARQPAEAAARLVAGCGRVDGSLLARYAAVEVMRRLIGVAQLPLPPTEGFRARLLEASRRAMLEARLEPLWP